MRKILFVFAFISTFSFNNVVEGQTFDESIKLLGIDTSYSFIQFPSLEAGQLFYQNMRKSVNGGRTVIYHYGASHIQSEIVTTEAGKLLRNKYGNAGPGFLFPFSAANTYNSINSKTSHTGSWTYAKSFQLPPKIPLGLRGMTVSTTDSTSSFSISLNQPFPNEKYNLQFFLDLNQQTPEFEICLNGEICFVINQDSILNHMGESFLPLQFNGEIKTIGLKWVGPSNGDQQLSFYGINVEHQIKKGLLYESFGVGASQFQSVLSLSKLEDQAPQLLPDIVIIDFGTNNILYTNTMDNNIPRYVRETVTKFKAINPNVSIIFTSMQDLYKNGKYIDAGIRFNEVVDSMATATNSLYWNFYDLSGGFKKIKFWNEQGYAQKDFIHLTKKGYELKGYLLFRSFENTLKILESDGMTAKIHIPVKLYKDLLVKKEPQSKKEETNKIDNKEKDKDKDKDKEKNKNNSTSSGKKYITVKKGDTLSGIARQQKTSVDKIKKLNNLKSDKLQIGQKLRVK
jgi:LysM repeat protein/lysophospholipase L1-like esterase